MRCVTRSASQPQVSKFAEGLKMPNGVAFHDGALYVAEQQRLIRFRDAEAKHWQPPRAGSGRC